MALCLVCLTPLQKAPEDSPCNYLPCPHPDCPESAKLQNREVYFHAVPGNGQPKIYKMHRKKVKTKVSLGDYDLVIRPWTWVW